MKLLETFKRADDGDIFAVSIEQGSSTYRIAIEACLDTIYLDDLLESGYSLVSLPYGFVKDGIDVISSLPCSVWVPTQDEEQELLDLRGKPYSREELMNKIDVSQVSYMQMPAGSYTIYTRDDFEKYLDTCSSINDDLDCLPLNYFVHPDALYSYEEFNSPDKSKYLNIIERRRSLTYTKFLTLRKFLFEHGLKEKFSAIDFLDCYFQWGIDGLRTNYISKQRETISIFLGADTNVINAENLCSVKSKEYGLMDINEEIHVPQFSDSKKWNTIIPREFLIQRLKKMPMGDTMVVQLDRPDTEECTVWQTADCIIKYTPSQLLIKSRPYNVFKVELNDIEHTIVRPKYWSDENITELQEIATLRAIARDIIDKNTDKTFVSTYNTLLEVGCSPAAALLYFITHHQSVDSKVANPFMDFTAKEQKNKSEKVNITYQDVFDYLYDRHIDEEKVLLIEDFMNGVLNLDYISTGEEADENVTVDKLFSQLYCVHFIMGISITEIQDRLQGKEANEVIEFVSGDLHHSVTIPKCDEKVKGYQKDLYSYRMMQLKTASRALYVINVARDMSTTGVSDKHIAVETLSLNLYSKQSEILLQLLSDKFTTAVLDNVVSEKEREKLLEKTKLFAVQQFFNVALNGKLTYPKSIPLQEEDMSADSATFMSALTVGIEATWNIADSMVGIDGTFNFYVVNADIYPLRVVPHKNVTSLIEYPFLACWVDIQSTNPALYAKSVQKGIIPNHPWFQPWEYSYVSNNLVDIDATSDTDSLYMYKKSAFEQRLKANLNYEFESPVNPYESQYPKLFPEQELVRRAIPYEAPPKYSMGERKELVYTGLPNNIGIIIPESDNNVGFQNFYGFTAEDLYYCPDIIFKEIPLPKRQMYIWEGEYFITDDKMKHDYRDIVSINPADYSVYNIYGRTYIVRDSKGVLWRCII